MNKIIPFLILCFLTYSCGKLELPDSSSQKGKDKAGKVETPENTTCQDTLSVTEALTNGKEDSYYAIVGYIVGYGNGHSKSFSFGLPDKSTPCLIIADTKVESEHVLPINIGSTNSEFRKKLDLYFHPELLGKK